MLIILFLKGWKFMFEKVVGLLEHSIKYCQAQPQTNICNQMDDGMEEEMLERGNKLENGKKKEIPISDMNRESFLFFII
jgi:hypothetical protein